MASAHDIFFREIERSTNKEERSRKVEVHKALYERLSDAQKHVSDDQHQFVAVLACRRTGKSFYCGTELFRHCLRFSYSNCLYVTLTKGSGRGILWDLLKRFDQEYELGCKFHNTNLVCSFSNGSKITFVGAENKSEIDKIRGQGYDLVFVDECKSFPALTLRELIDEVVGPALIDRDGRLILIGTPGAILAGPFFEITHDSIGVDSRPWEDRKNPEWQGREFEWSVHRWGLDDAALPIVKKNALQMKKRRRWADDDPTWLREYLGQWVASDDALVYYGYNKVEPGYNNWYPNYAGANPHGLPGNHEWKFVLGLDLGYTDDVAIEVAAYSDSHPNAYQVYDFKSPRLIVPEIAAEINKAKERFGGFEVMIGDMGGLGKTILATLSAQYGLDIQAAEKREKFDHIKLLNSDLLTGRVKILADSLLAEEWGTLQFDATGTKEHHACANHCSDAFLYIWRHLYHHFWQEKEIQPEPGTFAWEKARDLEAQRKAAQRIQRGKNKEWWDQEIYEPVELPWERTFGKSFKEWLKTE